MMRFTVSVGFLRIAAVAMVGLWVVQAASQSPGEKKANQDKGKKNAQAKKETSRPVDGSTLGPGSFLGLARGNPTGNRLVLVEPPVNQVNIPPIGNTKGLTAQQKKSLQAARQKAQAQWKELMAKPRKEVEFQIPESVPVRFMVFPEPFDDKGNLIKPSAEEKEKMRGPDKSLPGFTGRLDQIKEGQWVRVDQTGTANNLTVKIVVVLGDANTPVDPPTKEKGSPKNKKGN